MSLFVVVPVAATVAAGVAGCAALDNLEPVIQFATTGIDNPLGARALYLYRGGKDTMFRIHGTNEPDTIGQAVSSGCIRMRNIDVIDLYTRVKVGAKVVVK
jgi:lipoprotein-anchoring transpeptidase ErfK/SrfK